MARKPTIDTEYPEYDDGEPSGRDTASLGPSDSSDTGSDVANLAPDDGHASDSGGTGERRGAAGDAHVDDAADIGVDRIFEPETSPTRDAADAALPPEAAPAPAEPRRRRRRGAQHGGRSLSRGTRRR